MTNSEGGPAAENPGVGETFEMPKDGGNAGPIVVANEFADVIVRKVMTRNGVRLQLWSPRRGTCIRLDAVALDVLSYQDPEFITDLLSRTPGA